MDLPRWNIALELDAAGCAFHDMVWIPGGAFRLYRDQGCGRTGGLVQAFVTGFWMDRTPVSVRQFAEFVAATDYADGLALLRQPLNDRPAVHVTYRDAEAYSAWAHKELPTEAEWEFAAQGAYGLRGMASGIWEWCADWYLPGNGHESRCVSENLGDMVSADSLDSFAPRKLLKAGSRCPKCLGRTCAQPIDVAADHIGFRCVAGAKGRSM
jgi:sulfatase modifying factor 1